MKNGVKSVRRIYGMVEINSESMEKEKFETKFGCPGCYDVFNDLPSLSSHISNTHSLTPEDETTSDEAFANCQSQVELSLATEPTTVEPTAKIPVENADKEIEIIGNTSLCPFLRSTTDGLKEANQDIITNIWNKFREVIEDLI
ncbi:hypothetical protein MFLAVUS_003759 [Mucor flavus]|uniref:C2H2-type domain-containing protein n=1 Tax=Mucor flavus TaxID=439312 RepID=A0ABP9YTZ2_9FUNG